MDERFGLRDAPWARAMLPQPPLQQQQQQQYRGDAGEAIMAWHEQQAEPRWQTNNGNGGQSPQQNQFQAGFPVGRPPFALAQRSMSSSLTDQTRPDGQDAAAGPSWPTGLGRGGCVPQQRSVAQAQFGTGVRQHRPPLSAPHRASRLPVKLTLNICDDLINEVNDVLTGKGTATKSEAASVASGSQGGGVRRDSEAAQEDSAASGQDKSSSAKRSAKLSLVPGNDGKIKASNFHAHSVSIGQWKCRSRHEGDLVAKVYFAKKKLVWEVLEGELKKKIEFPWSDIVGMRTLTPESGFDVWEIDLKCPPTFHREMNPQPKKHTLWEACADFTNGQASTVLMHRVLFPNATLERHYERLMAFDSRLQKMMEEHGHPKARPELSDDPVDGSLHMSSGTDLLAPSGALNLQELRYRDPVMPEHDPSLPPQILPAQRPHRNYMEQQQQQPSNQPFFHMPGYASQFPRVPLDQLPSGSLDGLPPRMHNQRHGVQNSPEEDAVANHTARFSEWVRSAQFQGLPQQRKQPQQPSPRGFEHQEAMQQEVKRQRLMMAAEMGTPSSPHPHQPHMSPQQQAWSQREAMMQQQGQHARFAQPAMYSNGN